MKNKLMGSFYKNNSIKMKNLISEQDISNIDEFLQPVYQGLYKLNENVIGFNSDITSPNLSIYGKVIIGESLKSAFNDLIEHMDTGIYEKIVEKEASNAANDFAVYLNPENKQYLQSGFKLQCPEGFDLPDFQEWINIRDNCKIKELNKNNFDIIANYLDTEEEFLNHYYSKFCDSYSDIYNDWKERVFNKSTGREVFGKEEIDKLLSFCAHFQEQLNKIRSDIDIVNKSKDLIDNILNGVDTDILEQELIDLNSVLNEKGIRLRFKSADEVERKETEDEEKERRKRKESEELGNKKVAKVRIMNYYMASMELINCKIKILKRIKNKVLRILSAYIKVQKKKSE